jgi:hypothetical protein
MSLVVWCDKGNHPFSGKDPNRQHFTQTKMVDVPTGNSYGQPTYQERQQVTSEMDICGPCWADENPFEPKEKDAVPELELDSETWQAGFDAGEAHALRKTNAKSTTRPESL